MKLTVFCKILIAGAQLFAKSIYKLQNIVFIYYKKWASAIDLNNNSIIQING